MQQFALLGFDKNADPIQNIISITMPSKSFVNCLPYNLLFNSISFQHCTLLFYTSTR